MEDPDAANSEGSSSISLSGEMPYPDARAGEIFFFSPSTSSPHIYSHIYSFSFSPSTYHSLPLHTFILILSAPLPITHSPPFHLSNMEMDNKSVNLHPWIFANLKLLMVLLLFFYYLFK